MITVERPEKVVPFCTNLRLKGEHERAVAALDEARRNAASDPREAGSPALTAAAVRVQELERDMQDHTVEFTIRGLRRKVWVEFFESNPARPDNVGDKRVGFDVSALDPIIAQSIVAVTSRDGKPAPFDPAAEWDDLADQMTNGQWSDFANAVIEVNHEVRSAPFSPLASVVIRRSEQTSTEPPS